MTNNFTDSQTNKLLQQFYNNFLYNKDSLINLFKTDPLRANKYAINNLNCLLDYSKNWVSDENLKLLFKIADNCDLSNKIEQLFSGAKINTTENRAALHTALRSFATQDIYLDNANISQLIQQIHQKIKNLSNKIANRQLLGFSGKPINTIVNIGIGGSDLGPKMVYTALKPNHNQDINCYFVSNIDPADISGILAVINPETTLFIIASKSFTTIETLTNAKTARKWLLKYCEFKDLKHHFIGVTNAIDKAVEFGIAAEQILPMWDWVGGRYSLWSAIGLSIALGTSYQTYCDLLQGAYDLDNHFRSEPWSQNMPVILALLGIGYINYANCQSHALLPYCQNLEYFSNYVQQLDMESNGKIINQQQEVIKYKTGPIIWGAPGTNGQHAFHQLLHQGSHIVPCDFIVPVNSDYEPLDQHQTLVANAFAQAKTLLDGYIESESESEQKHNTKYKYLSGNKPSTTIILPKLSPYYLGLLIALYEHKVFTQGVIWQINSFDQWGVERGKTIANNLLPYLTAVNKQTTTAEQINLDQSTLNLINKYQELSINNIEHKHK